MAVEISRFLTKMKRANRPLELMSDDELLALPVGSTFMFDAEVYINFFFIAFKLHGTKKYVVFERSDWHELQSDKLSWMLSRFKLVSFNGINFDMPLIFYALSGATPDMLKMASDDIIANKLYAYSFKQKYNIEVPTHLDHIDIIEVAPLSGSLKLYGARLHSPRLQDLPYPPDWTMDADSAEDTRQYCGNDLDVTELLYDELNPEINLRVDMSAQYGLDLRSKSDAQIAEAVICSELKKVLGYYPKKPNFAGLTHVEYAVPNFIKFETKEFNNALDQLRSAKFPLNELGSPCWPAGLGEINDSGKWELLVNCNQTKYKIGMGGLHSQETNVAHIADEDVCLEDWDFSSFYPRIILNLGLFPEHLGTPFLTVYETIVNRRLEAKKTKNKTIADSLKICINGTFGKLGEAFSRIYSPQLLLQVTITGQLMLLMLIERLELAGIEVVSGNTDGIILKYNKQHKNKVRGIISKLESDTNFQMEETKYTAVYSRDVNNYIAIKDLSEETEEERSKRLESKFLDDRLGVKTKGCFAERGSALNSVLSKNPENLVVIDGVLNYLTSKTDVSETIRACKDFRRFLSIRTAKGGACKGNEYLGKIVRWYYGQGEKEAINYIGSGNKVANTDGAKPAMDLPNEMPNDVDYRYYIMEANKILYQLQAKENPRERLLF